MNWDTYNTINITEKYVYRYVTIEKLIDFLTTNSIYLARLDTFEDNLENIEPYEINELNFVIKSKLKDANPDISEDTWDELIERSRVKFSTVQQYLHSGQKKRYVSCWILNDTESFAMWDIYGKAGFAIKFEREYFQEIVKSSINQQISPTNKIDLLVVGKVKYQNFDNMMLKEQESLIKYSVFRKHLAFKHESEYRIVGCTNSPEDEVGLRYLLPPIEGLKFDIIANPRISSFQFQQYQNILNKFSDKYILKESDLKPWLEFRNTNF